MTSVSSDVASSDMASSDVTSSDMASSDVASPDAATSDAETSVLARVRVRVPATSANLGPGFDAFGLALSLYDEVEVAVLPSASGLTIEVAAEEHGSDDVALDETHLVARAVRAGFDDLGIEQPGLFLRCTNRIPHGRGLGSSAAAIVAGLAAARELVGEPADPAWLLRLAARMEGHPDNVAAAVYGGFTVAWAEPGGARALRVEPDSSLRPVVFVPNVRQSTEASRGALPSQLDHADAAWNVGRAALLAVAVAGGVAGSGGVAASEGVAGSGAGAAERQSALQRLLFAATEDRLHQPFRLPNIPDTQNLVELLRTRGIAAVLSGSGPTVIALAVGDKAAELAADAADLGFQVLPLAVDRAGVEIVSVGSGSG